MPNAGSSLALPRVLSVLAALLVGKVVASVAWAARDYVPPNFQADFLLGREAYFWGSYAWAFYAHLLAGPLSLVVGTILVSDQFRQRAPVWHRRLGRVQGILVLLLVVPSGLVMAWRAQSGAIAGAGLAALAVATAACMVLGWKAAVQRRFGDHRLWMSRTYLLLCSAVVIRLIGGLATVAGFDALWLYPLSAWASWLVPLALFESVRWFGRFESRQSAPRLA
jgi:hypothetical protein